MQTILSVSCSLQSPKKPYLLLFAYTSHCLLGVSDLQRDFGREDIHLCVAAGQPVLQRWSWELQPPVAPSADGQASLDKGIKGIPSNPEPNKMKTQVKKQAFWGLSKFNFPFIFFSPSELWLGWHQERITTNSLWPRRQEQEAWADRRSVQI